MTRLTILLMFSLSALVLSSPIDPQTSANRFFGQIFEKYFAEAYEELFDLLHGKWSSFYPGLLKDDEIAVLKKDFIGFFENEGTPTVSFTKEQFLEVGKRMEKEIDDRIEKLTEEGRAFVIERKNDATRRRPRAEFMNEFADFRKKYEALSTAAKESIEAQFPIFGKIPEIQAHLNVVDRLVRHMTKLSGKKF
ncbi:hypothetical protein PMAYCL1PPCAC_28093 [Pristionchus mayeri]|uniref:SXP/RAL-2 family protein Ani s 5-like cation-binding domain-containing protein n=1 Tax=Pristionchus mayeri TaxID=1317129 RepID=A0AAN5I9P5_9BILA|nr:hypothetical protein PMAYCL1PPCAC_28093 [Pristionchus mayeri]